MRGCSVSTKVVVAKHKKIINYCFIILDDLNKNMILIDPAWEWQMFARHIELQGYALRAVLLTHHHFDHSHLANRLATTYNAPVFMSQVEIDCYNFKCRNLIGLQGSERLKFGEIDVGVILTPGHTAGSCCFLINDCVFSGDTLFIEGCGICTGIGACPIDMFNSLQKLKSILKESHLIFPGHRFHAPIGQPYRYVLRNNIYLSMDNVNAFVNFRMRKPRNMNALQFK